MSFSLFLAAMSSSSSDSVNQSVRLFVRAHPFFLISSFTNIVAKVLYSIVSLGCRLQFTGCMLHIGSCRLQVAGCMLQAAGYTLHVASCMLQAAGCRLQDAGCRLKVAGCG